MRVSTTLVLLILGITSGFLWGMYYGYHMAIADTNQLRYMESIIAPPSQLMKPKLPLKSSGYRKV